MVKTVRIDDEEHSKLKEIQENASKFGKPPLKEINHKAIDKLYDEVVNDE